MKKTTLAQFIEEQIEIFDLEDSPKMYNRLKVYFTRKLKELNIWDNAEEKLISKSITKLFTDKDLEILSENVGAYLIKQKGLDVKKYLKIQEENRKLSKEFFDRMTGEIQEEEDIEDLYNKNDEPTQFEILNLMITSLFEEKFEIDFKKWKLDKTIVNSVDFEDEQHTTNFKYILASERLKHASKSYVKKKN